MTMMYRFAIIVLSIMLGACGNPDGSQPSEANLPEPEEVVKMEEIAGTGNHVDPILEPVGENVSNSFTLMDTRWELVHLDGKSVSVKPDREPVHFVIDGQSRRIAGFAGCNRFTGPFELKEGKPSVGPMAVTSMACRDGMEQEQVFLRALEVFNRYELDGGKLRLFVDRMLLASFTASLPD